MFTEEKLQKYDKKLSKILKQRELDKKKITTADPAESLYLKSVLDEKLISDIQDLEIKYLDPDKSQERMLQKKKKESIRQKLPSKIFQHKYPNSISTTFATGGVLTAPPKDVQRFYSSILPVEEAADGKKSYNSRAYASIKRQIQNESGHNKS